MRAYSPTKEEDEEGVPLNNTHEGEAAYSGCGCFKLFCFEKSWLVKKLHGLKEASEVVAGPKWKNLIRKMGKYFNPKKPRCHQFQYDPESYALNFDHGVGHEEEEEEEDGVLLGFSSRFAPPVSGDHQRTAGVL